MIDTQVRAYLHEILNALAIARGHSEAIQSSLNGDSILEDEKMKEKIAQVYCGHG
jgi:hypothetical protein